MLIKPFALRENLAEYGIVCYCSLKKPIDKSYYFCKKQQYENFELTLSAKFITSDLKTNGGISLELNAYPIQMK